MAAAVTRTAVVTGGNKGLGYSAAKQLAACGEFSLVLVGCRDAARGRAAAANLGPRVESLPLDLDSDESICEFVAAVERRVGAGGALDCLVNNAGTAFKGSDPLPFNDQTAPTLRTNFYQTLGLTRALLPLLERSTSPRIVNVASMAGRLGKVSPALQRRFSDSQLSLESLEELVREFEAAVAESAHTQRGWPNSNYAVSKLALIAATKVLARDLPRFRVNACCPGYCDTDMTSHRGTRSADDGAKNAVLCALVPDAGFTGEFVENEAVSTW